VLRTVTELDLDAAVQDALGELIRSAQVGSLLDQRIAQLILGGQDPGPQASARKADRRAIPAGAVRAEDGAVPKVRAPSRNKEVHDFPQHRCLTIAGGTEQILLTLAASACWDCPASLLPEQVEQQR